MPREELAEAYRRRYPDPAVAEYGLAVRALLEESPRFGTVDTWGKLAKAHWPDKPREVRETRRKRLSRHFTAAHKGPPWLTVELVVKHTVPDHRRDAVKNELATLYEAARGERPPHRPDPAPGLGQTAEVTGSARRGAHLADLRRENDDLRRENDDLKRRLAVQQAEPAHPNATRGRGPTTLGLNAAPRPRTPIDAMTRNAGPFPVEYALPTDSEANERPPRLDTNSHECGTYVYEMRHAPGPLRLPAHAPISRHAQRMLHRQG